MNAAARACLCALLVAAAPAMGQVTIGETPPPYLVAMTYCTSDQVRTLVDHRVVATDSFPEYAAHEAKHREQLAKGFCPGPNVLDWRLVLDWEIEAYCAMRPIRMTRLAVSKDSVDSDFRRRLTRVFHHRLPPDSLAKRYREGCP